MCYCLYMVVNVNGIYYAHVCEQARWAHSAGNSAIENLCIIILLLTSSCDAKEVTFCRGRVGWLNWFNAVLSPRRYQRGLTEIPGGRGRGKNDSCIKVNSDDSCFNVSLILRGKNTTEESRSGMEPWSFCLPLGTNAPSRGGDSLTRLLVSFRFKPLTPVTL